VGAVTPANLTVGPSRSAGRRAGVVGSVAAALIEFGDRAGHFGARGARAHFFEVQDTAARHASRREEIETRAAAVLADTRGDPVATPGSAPVA
jgi:hypothetical protein